MTIETLADLKKLIKLCQAMGVNAIEIGDIKMNIGSAPPVYKVERKKPVVEDVLTPPAYAPGGITAETIIPTGELTEDQMLFYSSQEQPQ